MQILDWWRSFRDTISRLTKSGIRPIEKSLHAKIAVGVVFPLVIILLLFSVYEFNRDRSAMLSDLSVVASETGDIIETTLRHEMLESDFEGIQRILDTFYSRGSFESLYILDSSGKVIFAPGEEDVGMQLNNQAEECQQCHNLPVGERPTSIVIESDSGNFIFRSMKPIYNDPECEECHQDSQRIRGLLLNDISIVPYTDILITDLKEQFVEGAIIIGLAIVIVYYSLNRFVLHGIEKLTSAMAEFAKGHQPAQENNMGIDEIGQLAAAFKHMANEVEARYRENFELTERLNQQSAIRGHLLSKLITSQEDERKRLARDLHDEFGQALSGLALKTESIAKLVSSNPEVADQELSKMGKLIQTTTDKMYDMIKAIRPSLLDDLGLIPAMKDFAKRGLENANIDFLIDDGDFGQRLPREIEITTYRMFQEAVHNVVKHSGATEIQARLSTTEDEFKCVIADNGVGFEVDALSSIHSNGQSYGLLGMYERLSLCGGTLEISSAKGQGTTLSATIPLPEDERG